MKITFGYFSSNDGTYLSQCPVPSVGNYYLVTATVRKKICEHPDTSPYRFHRVDRHYKTFCDENRIDIHITEYKSFKKFKEYKGYNYWRYDNDADRERRTRTLTRILQYIIDNKLLEVCRKFKIMGHRYIYVPGWFELNWDTLEHNILA